MSLNLAGLYGMAGGEEHKFKEGDDINRFLSRVKQMFIAGATHPTKQIATLKLNVSDRVREEIEKFEANWLLTHPGAAITLTEINEHMKQHYELTDNEKRTRHALLQQMKQQPYQTVEA